MGQVAALASVRDIDHGWKKIKKRLKEMDGAYTAVGFPGQTTGKEKVEGGAMTVAELAAIHEFGTRDGKIPKRPFMRDTYKNKEKQVMVLRDKLYNQILDLKTTAKKGLGKLGAWYAGQIQETITRGFFKPLKKARKDGSNKPLMDTGTNLRNRVTHKEFT